MLDVEYGMRGCGRCIPNSPFSIPEGGEPVEPPSCWFRVQSSKFSFSPSPHPPIPPSPIGSYAFARTTAATPNPATIQFSTESRTIAVVKSAG